MTVEDKITLWLTGAFVRRRSMVCRKPSERPLWRPVLHTDYSGAMISMQWKIRREAYNLITTRWCQFGLYFLPQPSPWLSYQSRGVWKMRNEPATCLKFGVECKRCRIHFIAPSGGKAMVMNPDDMRSVRGIWGLGLRAGYISSSSWRFSCWCILEPAN